ncbi:hypothetical protein SLEP1_g40520 [Rubroshorea leprosula]|uniref:CASP-like protein n=1 Tax=Rubroshorea leprosula TaxID=152421 RepID=A0AAV5L3N0_9ROSI|nr:hypothetical protein SLEP1_g40520 [Rubroshorea leprosula]
MKSDEKASSSLIISIPNQQLQLPFSSSTDSSESSSDREKRKAPLITATKKKNGKLKNGKLKKWVCVVNFILRLVGIICALSAAAIMGTSDETLPFFTRFFQFQASQDDLPTFQFFVIAMAASCGYLVLSLPLSIVTIVRPLLVILRLLLLIMDTVALTFTTAAAAAAAAIIYLAHTGNPNTKWQVICHQFGDYCQKVSGAVVASFVIVVAYMLLILLSALALKK